MVGQSDQRVHGAGRRSGQNGGHKGGRNSERGNGRAAGHAIPQLLPKVLRPSSAPSLISWRRPRGDRRPEIVISAAILYLTAQIPNGANHGGPKTTGPASAGGREVTGLQLGDAAPEFRLVATDGREIGLDDVAGPAGLVVMFICNHCPYVRAVADRLTDDANALAEIGVGTVAIMPNDTVRYPQDSFENMGTFATVHGFPFPYVIDETQDVARAYGALCTPDLF
ncbi:MAG: thioredoxin family protein, partial [Rhodospirillaceae bacterium]|nr:thioredoxin family protein [Rhodospirillaceae bacterium]